MERTEIITATIHGKNASIKAERLVKKLQDESFFQFEVTWGTIPGGIQYTIEANCEIDRAAEALTMAFCILAD